MKGLAERAAGALRLAGILPARAHPFDIQDAEDLLPALLRCWRGAAWSSGAASRRCFIDWFAEQAGRGARLTWGIRSEAARQESWLGERFVWWPCGIPSGRLVGLASSRLPRSLETRAAWFHALRAACGQLDRRHDWLLSASATTTARFVKRAPIHFQLRVLLLNQPRTSSLRRWFRSLQGVPPADPSGHLVEAFLSPPLDDQQGSELRPDAPLRDRAVVAVADQLVVLHLRRGGQLERLVRARLAASPGSPVLLATGPQLVPPALAEELAQQGAALWIPEAACSADTERGGSAARPKCRASETLTRRAATLPMPPAESWDYLTHCTRRPRGPWPGQSEEQYLDELIRSTSQLDRSPLAALRRIIVQRRIVASVLAIRGGTPVVSFTAVPLAKLSELRTFRPHRGRWDFEPYGMCIRRSWLLERGGRQVRYGDEQLWKSLPEQERPFFQRSTSRSRRTGRTTDWQPEQEWRCLGDVDLTALPTDQGLVFVPRADEADQLVAISPWPIVVLGSVQ